MLTPFLTTVWCRYNFSIAFEDGKTVEANRRERPGLLLDAHGQPTHMLSGVQAWPPNKDKPGSCRSYTVLTEVNGAAPAKSDDHHRPSLKRSAGADDAYVMGAVGASCVEACAHSDLPFCNTSIVTDNTTALFTQLGISCNGTGWDSANGTVHGGLWSDYTEPSFVAIETSGGPGKINNTGWFHDCLGYIGVPAVSNCLSKFPTVRRLCHCSSAAPPGPMPAPPPPVPGPAPCPPYSAAGCGPSDWNPKYYPPLPPPCSCEDRSLCGALKTPAHGSRKEVQAFFNTPMNVANQEWANEVIDSRYVDWDVSNFRPRNRHAFCGTPHFCDTAPNYHRSSLPSTTSRRRTSELFRT
jgi:hypothetical protein